MPQIMVFQLSESLMSISYIHFNVDYSLFTKSCANNFTALLVYVDDLVITGNDLTEIHDVKALLHRKFCMKDLGPLRYFLDLEMAISQFEILFSQCYYVLDLLNKTCMLASKPSPSPYNPSLKLHCITSPPYHYSTPYRRLIGQLIYLTTTRPVISFALQRLM